MAEQWTLASPLARSTTWLDGQGDDRHARLIYCRLRDFYPAQMLPLLFGGFRMVWIFMVLLDVQTETKLSLAIPTVAAATASRELYAKLESPAISQMESDLELFESQGGPGEMGTEQIQRPRWPPNGSSRPVADDGSPLVRSSQIRRFLIEAADEGDFLETYICGMKKDCNVKLLSWPVPFFPISRVRWRTIMSILGNVHGEPTYTSVLEATLDHYRRGKIRLHRDKIMVPPRSNFELGTLPVEVLWSGTGDEIRVAPVLGADDPDLALGGNVAYQCTICRPPPGSSLLARIRSWMRRQMGSDLEGCPHSERQLITLVVPAGTDYTAWMLPPNARVLSDDQWIKFISMYDVDAQCTEWDDMVFR